MIVDLTPSLWTFSDHDRKPRLSVRSEVHIRPVAGSSVRKRPAPCHLFRYGRTESVEQVAPSVTLMRIRVRHCVECPKCLTRYVLGFSPYRNGAYLLPLLGAFLDEWTLYCSCSRPPSSSRWSWTDLRRYAVSDRAHPRGYGSPDEIVSFDRGGASVPGD